MPPPTATRCCSRCGERRVAAPQQGVAVQVHFAEFTPVAAVGGNAQCLVVPASLPAKSLAEFVFLREGQPQAAAARRQQRRKTWWPAR
jgi:tripartite-type tricarboxylate transporter receptor subunit TctC